MKMKKPVEFIEEKNPIQTLLIAECVTDEEKQDSEELLLSTQVITRCSAIDESKFKKKKSSGQSTLQLRSCTSAPPTSHPLSPSLFLAAKFSCGVAFLITIDNTVSSSSLQSHVSKRHFVDDVNGLENTHQRHPVDDRDNLESEQVSDGTIDSLQNIFLTELITLLNKTLWRFSQSPVS